ncbi:MAG: ribonuclease III [Acidobacteriaceae bacterium]
MTSRRAAAASHSPSLQDALVCSVVPARAALLQRLQELLGYRFTQVERLELALTHSSVASEEQSKRHSQSDNEQLEFLGDAVLGLVVTEHLVRAYPDLAEGVLTRLRAQFVSRQYLGQVAQQMSLGDFLRLGKGEEKSGGRRKSAILANAVEAILAAIYLDGGLESAAQAVRRLLDGKLDALASAALVGADVGDHKSALQEYFQAHGLGQPCYTVTSEAGPDHRKSFVVAVQRVAPSGLENTLASATGSRKKDAEQEAARLALEWLRAEEAAGPENSA